MFEMPQKVMFKHCDPAGIVFYPRYFEMMNDCVESWFAERLKWPFEDIHNSGGVPTANIATRFSAPSYHGDHLRLHLRLLKLGRSSLSYEMTATCEAELRFRTEATLVYVDLDGRPAPWPAPARAKIEFEMKGQT